MLSQISSRGVSFYNANHAEFHQAVRGRAPVPDAEWLVRNLPAGSRVVDAGCGTGEDTAFLAAHGLRVYAYDASIEMVRLAKGLRDAERPTAFRPTIRCHGHHELRLGEPAAGILASASLLFLEPGDLQRALRTLAGNLATDGYLLASFKRGANARPQPDGRVYYDRQPSDLNEVAAMAGLEPKGVREKSDNLGRDQAWVTFVLRRG